MQNKYFRFSLRLIAFPFFLGWISINLIKHAVFMSYMFLRYGAEMNIYNKEVNPVTIGQVYHEMIKPNPDTN
jgi:hypothetical protein